MVNKKTLSRNFKKLDLFSTDISFRENGGDSFGSIFGACISLIIAIVVINYSFANFTVMREYGNTTINEYITKKSISPEEFG